MATTRRIQPVRAQNAAFSWRQRLQTRFEGDDLLSLLITWGLVAVTALALNAAEWVANARPLFYVGTLAVLSGFLFARSRFSELVALVISSMYGVAAVLLTNTLSLVEEGTLWERSNTLLRDLLSWTTAAVTGGQPPHDEIVFVLFLSALFWYLGYNAAWHVFRIERPWRVIAPTGLVLVTNQFYYQGARSLDRYLVIFVVLALLLLVRAHLKTRESVWFSHYVSFPPRVRRAFYLSGGALAVLLVAMAWAAPAGTDDNSLQRVRDLLSEDTLNRWFELWNRLFSSIEGQGLASSDYYGGDELELSGAVQLGNQPVMLVEAPYGPRYYWRSTVYEMYDFGSWRWKHIRTVRAYTDAGGMQINVGLSAPGARQEVPQRFTMLMPSSELVYAAPQPVQFGLPVAVELNCVEDFGRDCIQQGREADVAIVRARQTLRTGESYTARSLVSVASADMLRQTGTSYPDWVRRLYLQGAGEVSPRVRDLAAQIVLGAASPSPYDKAKAIERWLRTHIQYNEAIPAPPKGSDPMEWFLFERREGYCNYYASAMILMLRSQGIPARMAAGFAMGTWDAERGAYLVRERDAHTWVEVYFPGVGWVEFEPTADEAPLDRPGDETPQNILPTVTPQPTPSPLPTATPTLPAPTQSGGANATPTSTSESPLRPSTVTPTPSPSPSPTPPPPPDVTRVDDGGTHVLKVLAMTLGALLLVVLGIVGVGLFVIWYVEYRGLRGLDAVQRAYGRLLIYARWVGIRLPEAATPDERRRALVSEVPEGEPPINAITHAYIEARYAPPRPDDPQRAQWVRAAWAEARRVFLRRKFARWLRRKARRR